MDRIVVVGASLAGVRTAEAIRREGFAGRLTLIGAEAHHPPFDRPPLSKQVLTGEWEPDQARLRVRPDALDAELLLGRHATELDLTGRVVVLDTGARIPFDGLVIATGSTPRLLPDTPRSDGLFTLRTIEDAVALRDRMRSGCRLAVVGAGFIGCEVAAAGRARGADVVVVEAMEVPLERVLGSRMGDVVAGLHRERGVDLRLAVGVRSIEPVGDSIEISLSDGTAVGADTVVVGIGVRPATDWLEGSGLLLDDGVVCDSTLAAEGADTVVAAGDVARWPNELFGESMRVEHWTNAVEQAAHAARRLLLGAEAAGPFRPVPYFWSDQYDTKLQFVGSCRPDDEMEIAEGRVEDGKFTAVYSRDRTVRAALCVNSPARMVHWRNQIAAGASAG